MITVAALYVEEDGAYYGMPGVDPWPESRDARTYAGPYPIIAHPPCERWGRYWSGGPSARVRRKLGDDGGCFEAALSAARRFGGVLEHPDGSHAFRRFSLATPPKAGGWVRCIDGGWTCCVEQGHYGHPARKATWLYCAGRRPPDLIWGPSSGRRLDEGFHSAAERRAARARGDAPHKRLSRAECAATPSAFRDLLISIASGCRP